MSKVWIVEWVCYPYIDGFEERHIENVFKSTCDAIEWCNNDEEFESNFLIIGEDQDKFFNRYAEQGVGHYEISCWDIN